MSTKLALKAATGPSEPGCLVAAAAGNPASTSTSIHAANVRQRGSHGDWWGLGRRGTGVGALAGISVEP